MSTGAWAQQTEVTGGGQPFTLGGPALGLTQVLSMTGTYPGMASADSAALGMVHTFAGSFGPDGAFVCAGQVLPVQQNTALYSVLWNTYGGSGPTTYGLPNLQARVMVGAGAGPGLTTRATGDAFGALEAALDVSTMPAHLHVMADGGLTGVTGNTQPLDVHAPTLTLTPMMAVYGIFPSSSSGTSLTFIGEIRWFAGSYVPENWVPCDGRLLAIADYEAAYMVLGTTYGGDGVTTFAVPDLRGRVAVGTGQGPGLSNVTLGQTFGSPFVTLSTAQLPMHLHGMGADAPTATAGGNQSFTQQQPALGITWLIATTGYYPSQTGQGAFNSDMPYLGELIAFAGNFAPRGYLTASGQILPINQNTALFSLLGTSFGGNGSTTFALPDLRGRTPIGTGGPSSIMLGEQLGVENRSLSVSNLPPHVHTFVPEPPVDAGVVDAGADDAGAADAGELDAGTADAGDPDAGDVDAGDLDAGLADAGDLDAGDVDAGELDAGVADAGDLDAGEVDAGDLDAGLADAGALDAGVADAGDLDAGHNDAGVSTDAGVLPDGGSDTPEPPMGCGCSSGAATTNLFFGVLVMLARMRRRRA